MTVMERLRAAMLALRGRRALPVAPSVPVLPVRPDVAAALAQVDGLKAQAAAMQAQAEDARKALVGGVEKVRG